MARGDNLHPANLAQHETIVAGGDLASAQRTIGGLLWQCETFGLSEAEAVRILRDVGVPAHAYGDPSFPISLQQDFEMLNEVRKHMWPNVSMEVGLFQLVHFTRAHMFGALGMAWQSAPTLLEAVRASITYPQMNWGRSRMVLSASEREDRIEFRLDKIPVPLGGAEDVRQTYKYALLLDITNSLAIILDIVSDRALVKKVRLPFSQPSDWSVLARTFKFAVEFDAEDASIVAERGFFHHVPKRAYPLSFKLAMKLVEKESALLAEDSSLRDQVVRWLWASTPPLKKPEVAKLLGLSERSLTRKLATEGCSYNTLFTEVQLERAENLLANPKLTISQVAYRMGYTDPAAFTRALFSRSPF